MLVLTDSELSTMIASSESSLVPVPSQCAGPQSMTPGVCPDYPHSPSASKAVGHHIPHPGVPSNPMSPRGPHQNHQWDINDSTLPVAEVHDPFELWPSGHYRRVYRGDSDDARRHVSGWAMRNTNNHNALILKKSCLGVLVCSLDCLLDSGRKVHLRPAICDKARRKQIGKPCPNPGCHGKLTLLSCRGHCGYPVTHFWRHVNNSVFFQAKGYHDHPRPEVKSLSDKGRHNFSKQLRQDGERIFSMPTKRRFPVHNTDDVPDRKIYIPSGEEVMCSCPPFECVCPKSAQAKNTFMPSAFGFIRDSPSHTYLPHRSPPVPGLGMEQLTHGPFTQINITNTCLPAPGLEVSIPGIDIYKNCSKFAPHNYYHDNDMKIFRYGSGEVVNNPMPHGQHMGRSPIDDLRSPQVANCPGSAGLQHMNSVPRNFSGSAASCNQANIYINDGRDDYSRYRINSGQCYNKGRNMPASVDDRSQALGLSLKTEPGETVFRDIPSSPHGGQSRSYQPESIYNPVSPNFNSDSILSPRTVECQTKYERTPELVTKEQDHHETPQELTYITLTSPPRQRESMQPHRELHSCRLGHMNRSPSTVEPSLDNVIFSSLPHQPTRVDATDADQSPITEVSPRHQDSRDMVMTPSSSTPSRRSSPSLPRLVLGDDLLNQQNNSGRSNTLYPPFTTYHDTPSTPYSLTSDGHMPSYPPSGSGFGSSPIVPYGFYCNDMFTNPSQQNYRNRSINITLTYN